MRPEAANFAKHFVECYVEPRPGIPPTPSHTIELIGLMKRENCKVILVEDLALSCTLNHLVWHRIAPKSMNARLDTDSITTHNSRQVRMPPARSRRGRPAASRWLSATGVRDREVVRCECACITGVSKRGGASRIGSGLNGRRARKEPAG
jgi:hypothetical protein